MNLQTDLKTRKATWLAVLRVAFSADSVFPLQFHFGIVIPHTQNGLRSLPQKKGRLIPDMSLPQDSSRMTAFLLLRKPVLTRK
ncbi:hypothetical protein [Faecalispora sporosphaeroides]|uniref:hypothetical protein n=1 Tax=Faecalispora sporosphaeroides TaxID=1549 RepID=UPI0012B67A3E|nr:hypothetical protein [Faecalispora sporosphaeroides]